MRRLLAPCVLLCGVLLLATACGGGGSGPEIDNVDPGAAAPGATIELTGKRFCGTDAVVDPDGTCATPPAGSVEFGTEAPILRGTIQSWSDETISVMVPAGATAGDTTITVKVNEEVSNTVSFTVE